MTLVTWNPSDQNGINLSNGNLTATGTSSHKEVRATIAKSSGKYYWEIKILSIYDTIWNISIGISKPGSALISGYVLGQDIYSWGYANNGYMLHNNDSITYAPTYTVGDVIGIALDIDNGTLSYYKNGVPLGQAYNGLIGITLMPAISLWSSGNSVVANFGATAFVYPDVFKSLGAEWKSYDENQIAIQDKCLIKQQDNYYTVQSDGTLQLLGTPTDNAQKEQWFNDYGVEDLKEALLIPDANGNKLIDSLNDQFEIRMMKAK